MSFLKRINYLGRFIYLFIIVGILLSILSVGVFYYHESKMRKTLYKEEVKLTLGIKQRLINHDFNNFIHILTAVSQNHDFQNFLKSDTSSNYKRVNDLFNTIVISSPTIMQLRYIDADGKEMIRVDRKNLNSSSFIVPKDQLQDKSRRSYFTEASKKDKDEIYISKIDLNIERGEIEVPHKPVIRFAVPIFQNDHRKGILIVNIFLEKLLEEITASSMFNLYIYDQDGYLLTSNNADAKNWNRYLKQKSSFDAATLAFREKLISGISAETLYLGMNPKDEKILSIKNMKESLLLLVGVVIPIGFILAYFLAKIPKRLFDELEAREKIMIQQSKTSAMGEMIGAIAHQWRQPLNAVGVLAQEIEYKYDMDILEKDELKELNKELLHNLNYMSHTIDDFRNFFRPDKEKKVFDVQRAVEDSLKIVGKQLEEHNIKIDVQCRCSVKNIDDPSCTYEVNGYEGEFKQVIINLINNAREAIEENMQNSPSSKKEISIIIQRDENDLIIHVQDTGGGIKEDMLNSIFDIYISSKLEQQGTGLGLYMSKLIIERNMQGMLKAKNIEGGAEFEIFLTPDS